MMTPPPGMPIAPPTTPGPVVAVRHAIWPRVTAVFGWMTAIPSAILAAGAMGYPELSEALTRHLGDDGHDDLAGALSRYRAADVVVEALTIAAAVALCVISRRLWREGPPAGRALARWCLLKLGLVALNLGLLVAQSSAYFGSQPGADPADTRIASLIMIGWSAALSLPFPLGALLWLLLPGVRRTWHVSR